jgi:hypothetical protein
VNDEMREDSHNCWNTFIRASTDQDRGCILPVFSFFKIIDNGNSNIIRQKFNHSNMMGDIAESHEDSKKIDLKFIIGDENPYDAFAY